MGLALNELPFQKQLVKIPTQRAEALPRLFYGAKQENTVIHAFLAFIFLILWASPAYAYLDPGSGSMLLYALAGLAASLMYVLRGLYYRVTSLVTGKGPRDIESMNGVELVFYSEGGKYWNVFAPIIEALDTKGIKCAYLTSDEEDKGLEYDSPNVTVEYIGGEARSAAVLNRLTAKLVIMTTPQLGIFTLKRSKDVRHYAHVIHAPTDALIYPRYAFDHFDSVLCSGAHQMKSIRELEEKRGMPPKELFKTGLTYYDTLLKNLPDLDEKREEKTVLIAPTWGTNGLLTRYGSACLRPLLEAKCNVILRPHPQSYVSQPQMIRKIEDELKEYGNLTLDRSASCQQAMVTSDILISDLSGIIFDYAFLHTKPVIVVDCGVDRSGLEAEYVEGEIWEISARERLGRLINEDDFPLLPSIVNEMLLSSVVPDIEKFRNESLYNFGKAGETAAHQLIGVLLQIDNDLSSQGNGSHRE